MRAHGKGKKGKFKGAAALSGLRAAEPGRGYRVGGTLPVDPPGNF
jgi:hypothetical protein